MHCPYCRSDRTRVVDSREARNGEEIRRRRLCEASDCGSRFTTFERVERRMPVVVKKDGGRRAYDRGKVRNGILLASNKRQVGEEETEQFLNQMERKFSDAGLKEVDSRRIGQEVLRFLRTRDHVAYVRFASVYMDFQDMEEFKDLLTTLSGEVNGD
jgi:transcriptional repressor NrdR